MSRLRYWALRAVEFTEAAVQYVAAVLVLAIIVVSCITSFHPETQTHDESTVKQQPVRVDSNLV